MNMNWTMSQITVVATGLITEELNFSLTFRKITYLVGKSAGGDEMVELAFYYIVLLHIHQFLLLSIHKCIYTYYTFQSNLQIAMHFSLNTSM